MTTANAVGRHLDDDGGHRLDDDDVMVDRAPGWQQRHAFTEGRRQADARLNARCAFRSTLRTRDLPGW